MLKCSESRPVRKRCSSISAAISILSKPASRFQAFCSLSIRKRRIRPSLRAVASSLTRIRSRRRQLVASTSAIIWRTSCSLFGEIISSKNRYKYNFYSSECPLLRDGLTAASRNPGSLRVFGDNGSCDALPTSVFSALALSFAALSIGGVWAVMLYSARLGRGIAPVPLQVLAFLG